MSLNRLSRKWITRSALEAYSYDFTWMGRPIIQYPQDIITLQEIIWRVRPDLIIETGIAHGGGLVFYASMLELLRHGEVVGVELNLYPENRQALLAHPMSKRITIMYGSSIHPRVMKTVGELAAGKRTLVCLDSDHTHAHVLRELELYSPLVCEGSYIVAFDTCVEYIPARMWKDKPYGRGNNPATAVDEFLRNNDRFEVDNSIPTAMSTNPGGYLRCVG